MAKTGNWRRFVVIFVTLLVIVSFIITTFPETLYQTHDRDTHGNTAEVEEVEEDA